MSRCIGCETARDLLDAFLDGELSVDEQVMVESHLGWCRTCARRVEDMRLIGSALRVSPYSAQVDDTDLQAVESIQAGVLLRVLTEQEQSMAVRLKDLCSDMRLFWPLLGATTALLICITLAMLVLQRSMQERPESLAAMISTSQPGSEGNPLLPDSGVRSVDTGFSQYVDENRLSGGISLPRAMDARGLFEEVQHVAETEGFGDDAAITLQLVVSRDGRVANYRVLSEGGRSQGGRRPVHLDAVLADAVLQSRFLPGQTPRGDRVAVSMVMLIYSTTAVMPPPDAIVRAPRLPRQVIAPPAPPETTDDTVPPPLLPESASA